MKDEYSFEENLLIINNYLIFDGNRAPTTKYPGQRRGIQGFHLEGRSNGSLSLTSTLQFFDNVVDPFLGP